MFDAIVRYILLMPGAKRSIEVSLDTLIFIGAICGVGALLYRYHKASNSLKDQGEDGSEFSAGVGRAYEIPMAPDLEKTRSPSMSPSMKKSGRARSPTASYRGEVSNVKRDKAKTFMEQQKEHAEALKKAEKEEKGDKTRGRVMNGVSINEIRIHDISTLRDSFKSVDRRNEARSNNNMKYHKILANDDYVLRDIVRKNDKDKL